MKYARAHPGSELGSNLTNARRKGWVFVCYRPDGYPIFRESVGHWIGRVLFRRADYIGGA